VSLPAFAARSVRIGLAVLLVGTVVAVLQKSAPADVIGQASASPAPSATLTAARTARPVPTAAAFAITVSDAELTKSAAAGFPQTVNGVTVTDPQVRIDSDRVRLVARAKVLFGTTEFAMTATPVIANGRLDVRVDSATLAGFSVSSDTRASIQETVKSTIASFVPASVNVTSVTLASGMLTVQGIQR
jgi:hypothetical protein